MLFYLMFVMNVLLQVEVWVFLTKLNTFGKMIWSLPNVFQVISTIHVICKGFVAIIIAWKNALALTTWPTFSSRLFFYSRPTVIYVRVFLPLAVLFYEKTFISLSNSTKPSLIVDFLFSFKLKIIPNYPSRCVSIRFLERIGK